MFGWLGRGVLRDRRNHLPCMRALPAATRGWSVCARLLTWELTIDHSMPPAQQLEVGLPDVMMQGVEQYTQVG